MEEINYGDFAQERVVYTNAQNGDDWQYSLRPKHLREYIGQKKVKDNLDIFIKAAMSRGDALDHVLFYGPLAWVKPLWRGLLPMSWG